jgi:hypothetical protein
LQETASQLGPHDFRANGKLVTGPALVNMAIYHRGAAPLLAGAKKAVRGGENLLSPAALTLIPQARPT